MRTRQIGPDRLRFFSNLVFALITTLLLIGSPLGSGDDNFVVADCIRLRAELSLPRPCLD